MLSRRAQARHRDLEKARSQGPRNLEMSVLRRGMDIVIGSEIRHVAPYCCAVAFSFHSNLFTMLTYKNILIRTNSLFDGEGLSEGDSLKSPKIRARAS